MGDEKRDLRIPRILGVEVDEEKNKAAIGEQAVISTPDSKVKIIVLPTNEELAIARETVKLV